VEPIPSTAASKQSFLRRRRLLPESPTRSLRVEGSPQYGAETTGRPNGQELHADVDPLPQWVRKVAMRLFELRILPREDFVEMAVVNHYMHPGSSLGVHIDSKKLFQRPVITVRLLSDHVLSFGARARGRPSNLSVWCTLLSAQREQEP
jgi:alkylated DNA repair dioxygenase AlkB